MPTAEMIWKDTDGRPLTHMGWSENRERERVWAIRVCVCVPTAEMIWKDTDGRPLTHMGWSKNRERESLGNKSVCVCAHC